MALDVRDGLERHASGGRRRAGAGGEPVQAGLRLGRAAPRQRQRHGRHPAHGRVLVRPVPEPQADPGPRGGSGEPRDGAWRTRARFRAPCGDFARIGRYRRLRTEVEAARMAPWARAAVAARARWRKRSPAVSSSPGARGGQALGLMCRSRRGAGTVICQRAPEPRQTVVHHQGRPREARVLVRRRPCPCRATGSTAPGAHRRSWGGVTACPSSSSASGATARRARSPPSSATVAPGAPSRRCEHAWKGLRGVGVSSRHEERDAGRPPQRVLAGVPPGRRGARAVRRGAGR